MAAPKPQQAPEAQPSLRPKPGLGAAAAAVIALATVLGTLYLTIGHGRPASVVLWVPRSTIPAYERITEADVTSRTMLLDQVPDGVLKEKGSLVGHISLQPLSQDKPVPAADLGAALPPEALLGKVILAIGLTYSQAISGQLRSGDEITLIGSNKNGDLTRSVRLQVLDSRSQPGDAAYSVVLAVNAPTAKIIAGLDIAKVVVTRTRAYSY